MENLVCRNCGSHFNDRRSQRKCENCKGIKLIDLVPKETKGDVCEMWANGSTMKKIGLKHSLSYSLVQQIINAYLGIGEQSVLVTIQFN